MKGRYTTTHDHDERTSLTEGVSWELTLVSASCDAPPALPPLPAENESPDDAEP
jgi:hypothetical protein